MENFDWIVGDLVEVFKRSVNLHVFGMQFFICQILQVAILHLSVFTGAIFTGVVLLFFLEIIVIQFVVSLETKIMVMEVIISVN